MKAAAVQLNSNFEIEHNLKTCREWIAKAADEGATFITLPENFSYLGKESEKLKRAQEI